MPLLNSFPLVVQKKIVRLHDLFPYGPVRVTWTYFQEALLVIQRSNVSDDDDFLLPLHIKSFLAHWKRIVYVSHTILKINDFAGPR